MRKISLFFLFCIVTCAALASPAWVSDPYYGYEPSEYVCAVGYGKTSAEADTEARKEIAGYFGTSVRSDTSIKTVDYGTGGGTSDYMAAATSSVIDVSDIVGIEIDRRTQEPNGLYVSRAVLKRETACGYYSGRIEELSRKLELLNEYVSEDIGSLYCLEDVAEMTSAYKELSAAVRIYNALTGESVKAELSFDVGAVKQAALSSVDIQVSANGDVNGRISSTVKGFLTGCGLNVARRRARNEVKVTLDFENTEIKGNPYKFVRWSCAVSVIDTETSEIFMEYSASGREGQTTYSAAMSRAVSAVEKAVQTDFADQFKKTFIGE